jgi:hypothetical protein
LGGFGGSIGANPFPSMTAPAAARDLIILPPWGVLKPMRQHDRLGAAVGGRGKPFEWREFGLPPADRMLTLAAIQIIALRYLHISQSPRHFKERATRAGRPKSIYFNGLEVGA